MEKRPVGYQVYSAREDAEKDLGKVFKALSEMGYDGVEFAGFYGNSSEQVKELLDTYGLKAISSHVPVAAILEDMQGTIDYHKAIGCEYIAIPYLDDTMRPGSKGFAAILRMINKFAAMCKEAGIQLLYHNHDFEFVTISDMYGLDFIYEAVDEDILKTEIDTCWVKYAGLDPAEYLLKYTGRAPIVHLKDYVGRKGEAAPYALLGIDENEKKDTQSFEFRPVGYGCQDVKSVVEAGIKAGAKWFIVEQDMSVGRTPLEAAEMSIGTLKALGLK